MSLIQEALKREKAEIHQIQHHPPITKNTHQKSYIPLTLLICVVVIDLIIGITNICIYTKKGGGKEQPPQLPSEQSGTTNNLPSDLEITSPEQIPSNSTVHSTTSSVPDAVDNELTGITTNENRMTPGPKTDIANSLSGKTNDTHTGSMTETKWPDIKITAIAYSPDNPKAIINGSVYGVGESIGNAKILRITDRYIEITCNGEKRILRMH